MREEHRRRLAKIIRGCVQSVEYLEFREQLLAGAPLYLVRQRALRRQWTPAERRQLVAWFADVETGAVKIV